MALAKKLVSAVLLLTASAASAQEFHGVATYKSHREVNFTMEGEATNPELSKQIQEQLKTQFQNEFTLTFDQQASIYIENEELAAPVPAGSGFFKISTSSGSDVRYKNVKENRYVNQVELLGKKFLVRDSLIRRKWELVNETKNIGEYSCFKAVFKDSVNSFDFKEGGGVEEIKKERIITAWYTPQIPIGNGPADYYGLPGLILEVHDGSLSLVCTKIVINPRDVTEIEEPTKGKVVSQKEFDAIKEQKQREMMDNLEPESRDGGRVKVITIRG